MAKEKEIILKFNKIVKNLLIDTTPIVGKKYLNKYKIVTKFNKKLPIIKFSEYCLKYKNQILLRDPEYFLNYELYANEVSTWNDKEFYLNEVLNLKEIYITADNESKENLWEILTMLILLSEKYISFKK